MKLIDKDALVAEIEKRIKYNHERAYLDRSPSMAGREEEDKDILSFINALEVKETDIEKEIEDWVKIGPHTSYPWCTIPDAIRITAGHFFELGLKASNPTTTNGIEL